MSEAPKKEDKVLYSLSSYVGKVITTIDEFNKTAKPTSAKETSLILHDANGNMSETMTVKLDVDGKISNTTKSATLNGILSRDTNEDTNISASEARLRVALTEADAKSAMDSIKKITHKNPDAIPALEKSYLNAGKDGFLSEAENILLTSQLKMLEAEPQKPNVPKVPGTEPAKAK